MITKVNLTRRGVLVDSPKTPDKVRGIKDEVSRIKNEVKRIKDEGLSE
jgi:hypothetical protein